MDIKCKHCGSYLNIREIVTRCTECGKDLFNSKIKNMKNEFKKGDRVFVYGYGWGIVNATDNNGAWITFENREWYCKLSVISFTEYTLQGFTQERPLEPEIGKFYWFWDEEMIDNEEVAYAKLAYIDKDREDWIYHTKASYYYFISDKNPLL